MKTPETQFCLLSQIGKHIHAAGLWPQCPSKGTIYKWLHSGHIVTATGATGIRVVNIPATLHRLRYPI